MELELIDNVSKTLKDDLSVEIKKGSKLSIAAACFSIYAFQELKKELSEVEELQFIFTSPTFTTDKTKKEKREFYIPRLNRERSLYGTEFEVKLRNELTQKAIAKECAEWIKKKVTFKSNVSGDNMMGFMNLDDKSYMPVNGFTTIDLGCERGNNAYNMVQKTRMPFSKSYMDIFDTIWNDDSKLQDVTDEVIENITAAYQENSPDFIYFVTLYNIFNEFLEDISEDVLPNEATGFKDSKIWSIATVPDIIEKAYVPAPKDFDVAEYTKQVFFMYDGEQVEVDLRVDNALMKTMIDRFGEDVETLAYDMKSFRLKATVSVSPTFFGWLFGFAGKVQILGPASVKEQYKQMLLQASEETCEKSKNPQSSKKDDWIVGIICD